MKFSFSELVYPSCPLCRHLRIAMCVGIGIVIGTYAWQLVNMDLRERN